MKKYVVKSGGVRLDQFLTGAIGGVSRSVVQSFIKAGLVLVNDELLRASYTVCEGDEVSVREVKVKELLAKDVPPLEILYKSADILVINKPVGLVVHPSESGGGGATLVDCLKGMVASGTGEPHRPGIVHRLDKDTSGVLAVARTPKAYDYLVSLFKNRKVKKKYLALVKGKLEFPEGIIDSPISRSLVNRKKMSLSADETGKKAISEYKVLKEFEIANKGFVSLVEVDIKTGRTHQIRVHFSALGHPVVGDKAYGITSFNKMFKLNYGLERHFLHAFSLAFDGMTGKKIEVSSPLPSDLDAVIKEL